MLVQAEQPRFRNEYGKRAVNPNEIDSNAI